MIRWTWETLNMFGVWDRWSWRLHPWLISLYSIFILRYKWLSFINIFLGMESKIWWVYLSKLKEDLSLWNIHKQDRHSKVPNVPSPKYALQLINIRRGWFSWTSDACSTWVLVKSIAWPQSSWSTISAIARQSRWNLGGRTLWAGKWGWCWARRRGQQLGGIKRGEQTLSSK